MEGNKVGVFIELLNFRKSGAFTKHISFNLLCDSSLDAIPCLTIHSAGFGTNNEFSRSITPPSNRTTEGRAEIQRPEKLCKKLQKNK